MTEITDDPNYNYIVTHYHYSDVYTGIRTNKAKSIKVVLDTKGSSGNIVQGDVAYDGASDTYTVGGNTVNKYDPLNKDQRDNFEKIWMKIILIF